TLCIITIANLGLVGRVLVSFCRLLFGEWYMILPLGGVILSFYLIWKREWPNFFNRYLIGIYLILIAVLLLHHISLFELLSRPSPFVKKSVITNTWDLFVMEINGDTSTTGLGGGMVGALLYALTYMLFDAQGSRLVSWVLILTGIIVLTGKSYSDLFHKIWGKLSVFFKETWKNLKKDIQTLKEKRATSKTEEKSQTSSQEQEK